MDCGGEYTAEVADPLAPVSESFDLLVGRASAAFYRMHHPRSHSRKLLVALLVCVPLLILPSLAEANSRLRVGFLDNTDATANPAEFWRDAALLNVGFMRWDLNWKSMAATRPRQPRNPDDPAYDFAAADAFVRNAALHGLQDRVMFTLWRTPKWASSVRVASGYEAQMPRLQMWRDFVFACAKRYSGRFTPSGASSPLPRVVAWETWNEPNAYFALRPQWSSGKPVSPRNYVLLLNALRSEVNRAVPFKPTLVAGAMYKQGGPKSLTPVQFMRGLQAANARFDVLSMHPYNRNPKLGITDGADQSLSNPSFIGIGNFDTFIRLANEIFGRKYPIWITEFGMQTPAKGSGPRTVSFAQQARFVRKALARLQRLPQVERAAWFLLQDELPRDGAWYTTGLRKADGSPKPSFDAWMKAAKALQRSPIR